jgi:phosphoenolpyruvate carboxylase
VGTALKCYIQENPEQNTKTLHAMYHEWPFLSSILENSEVILRQTDLGIARYYGKLAKDKEKSAAILEDIEEEYQLTRQMIQTVTQKPLLSAPDVQTLKAAIKIKEPYLDPLNYIQVRLLEKYRSLEASIMKQPDDKTDPETEALLASYHRVIVSSIEGVATGLGTSG